VTDRGRAVVTGANRGIGLEVARQLAARDFHVVLGSRDEEKGERVAERLASDGHPVTPRQLDVADPGSVERFAEWLTSEAKGLDVLVNNAATHYDTWQHAAHANLDVVREAFETNLLGAWRMAEACLPLLRGGEHARIVNVSSGAGSLADMSSGGAPAYSASKAALNSLTRMLAADLRSDKILVNSVCPGWVATDMGGPGGRPVSEGAASVVWAAVLPDDGPTGGFFRDGRPIRW
jgi:NAD(P)-dependent dehydrogenase (short-subunit alcohol dehydrogenase family)